MIAGRRARKQTLIRVPAKTSIIVRNLSGVGDLVRRRRNPKSQTDPSQQVEDTKSAPWDISLPFSDSMMYLQQLSTLHEAGVLTDEEYLMARGRLLGS